ncbi:hypothetical protein BofuT4_uP055660.1 [Botrytis cinerea T4]|uniref:Uncharacterized protein n=1 Tax=Botryotinia fuckeliana (strain T4) TaxID=999810 RepID=G2XVZ5_BOTF4|nr:hypothetical protein BofuT4_uP055660.1 [Botrytis cinerea T4]
MEAECFTPSWRQHPSINLRNKPSKQLAYRHETYIPMVALVVFVAIAIARKC